MSYKWNVLKALADGSCYTTVEAIPDDHLVYNIMSAKHDFKTNRGDKDLLLDVVNQWSAEAKRRSLVIGPRRVVPWLDSDPSSPNRSKLIGVAFECPGCGEMHAVTTTQKNSVGAQWTWNGNWELPTITPSILRRDENKTICHVVVSEGKAKFLPDCPHALSDTEVELPEL